MSDAWIVLWVLSLFVVVLTILFVGWRRAQRRANEVKRNLSAQGLEYFSQTGAGQLGILYASIPFAEIVVSLDALDLIVFGRHLNISKPSVRKITATSRYLSNEIRIEHTDADLVAVFWSLDPSALFEALERFDWPVKR